MIAHRYVFREPAIIDFPDTRVAFGSTGLHYAMFVVD